MSREKLLVVLLGMLLVVAGCVASGPPPVNHESPEEVGQQIYRQGLQGDGQPVQALVMGDIPVSGDQFTCLHCHRYSGLGGAEGSKYVMPTSGPALYNPRVNIYHERPAYTDETLAELLRYGIDPGGNLLDPVMPLYELSESDMQALIAYLKTLSRDVSPGVSDTQLHIATVVGPAVDPSERRAMLAVLERFIQDSNGQSRRQEILAERGPFYHEYKNKAYREWVLHVWELSGPSQSWPQQLAEYYRNQPVFAMLSGTVKGPWQPIHDFCQQYQVPAILPNTDLPAPQAEQDFYTLYFSGGLSLEAGAMLADFVEGGGTGRVVQVFRDGEIGAFAADSLKQAAGDYPEISLETHRLLPGESWEPMLVSAGTVGALVVWGGEDVLHELADVKGNLAEVPIYLSATMLGQELGSIPVSWQSCARVASPFNLPEDQEMRARRTTAWIKGRKISLDSPRIQTQTWYASKVFHSGIKHIKRHFYRDYLLDALDHSSRLGPYASNYPRLSFGPKQRFLAKGAYLIDVGATLEEGTSSAEWLVP